MNKDFINEVAKELEEYAERKGFDYTPVGGVKHAGCADRIAEFIVQKLQQQKLKYEELIEEALNRGFAEGRKESEEAYQAGLEDGANEEYEKHKGECCNNCGF